MKVLLFLLLPIFCSSQVRISRAGTHNNTCANVANNTVLGQTFEKNKLYIVVAMFDSCNNFGSLSGGTTTWVNIAQVKTGSTGNSRRISIYRGVPTADETVNPWTFTCTNCFGLLFDTFVVEGAPVTNNGADAIKQVKIDSAAAGSNPSLTFSSNVTTPNGVMFFLRTTTNPVSATPETGFIEQFDEGCTFGGTVQVGKYMMYTGRTKDNTPSVTAGSSDWIGVAIEFHGRRIITAK